MRYVTVIFLACLLISSSAHTDSQINRRLGNVVITNNNTGVGNVPITTGNNTATWQPISSGGTPASPNGSVQYNNNGSFGGSNAALYAEAFSPGGDACQKIQSCLTAASAVPGGTCNAMGLASANCGAHIIDIPSYTRLLLGVNQIFTFTATPAVQLHQNSVLDCGGGVQNAGASLTLSGTVGGSDVSLVGAHNSTVNGCHINGVSMSDGSRGLDLTGGSLANTVSNNAVATFQYDFYTGEGNIFACDCYTYSFNNSFGPAQYGMYITGGAASGLSVRDQVSPGNVSGRVAVWAGAISWKFDQVDVEHADVGLRFPMNSQNLSTQNVFINPYLEDMNTVAQFDDNACGNTIIGGGGGGTVFSSVGATYLCNNIQDAVGLDGAAVPMSAAIFANTAVLGVGNQSLQPGLGPDLQLYHNRYTSTHQYTGASLMAGLDVGFLHPTLGMYLDQSFKMSTATSLFTPPTVALCGTATPGTATCSYKLACRDINNQRSAPSGSGSITNCPGTPGSPTLSSTNCVNVTWTPQAVDSDCSSYDVLTNTDRSSDGTHSISTQLNANSFKDTGQAVSAYTAATRNGLADFLFMDSGLFTNDTEQANQLAAAGNDPILELTPHFDGVEDTFDCRRQADPPNNGGTCFEVYSNAGAAVAGIYTSGLVQPAQFDVSALPSCDSGHLGSLAEVDNNEVACAINSAPTHTSCSKGSTCYTCPVHCALAGSGSYVWLVH